MNKLVFYLSMLLVVFTACENEESPELKVSSIISKIDDSANFETIIKDRTRLAQSLSLALRNDDFYSILIENCLNSKLSDAEVLYSDLVDIKIPNTKLSISEYLASVELRPRSKEEEEFYRSFLPLNDPLLSIVLMPGKGKTKNDLKNQSGKAIKVFIDKIINEFKDGEKIDFSENGRIESQPYQIDGEPDFIYFAIKLNEEYIAYDSKSEKVYYNYPYTLKDAGSYIDYNFVKSAKGIVKTHEQISIAYKNEMIQGNNLSGLETRSSCGLECERDCFNGKDAVTRIRFTHDYEGWPRGGPEFIMQYAFGTNNNVTVNPFGYVLSGSATNRYNLGGSENTWYTQNTSGTLLNNIQLLGWNKTTHSRDMMELWTEDDGSFKTYTINPSLKAKVTIAGVETEVGISGSIQFQAGDDNIGTVYVQYCDPWFNYWGYEYVVAGPSGDVFFAQRDRGY